MPTNINVQPIEKKNQFSIPTQLPSIPTNIISELLENIVSQIVEIFLDRVNHFFTNFETEEQFIKDKIVVLLFPFPLNTEQEVVLLTKIDFYLPLMCFVNFHQLIWLQTILQGFSFAEVVNFGVFFHSLTIFFLEAVALFVILCLMLKKSVSLRECCFLASFKYIYFNLMIALDIILKFQGFMKSAVHFVLWFVFIRVLRIPGFFYLETKFNFVLFLSIDLSFSFLAN